MTNSLGRSFCLAKLLRSDFPVRLCAIAHFEAAVRFHKPLRLHEDAPGNEGGAVDSAIGQSQHPDRAAHDARRAELQTVLTLCARLFGL